MEKIEKICCPVLNRPQELRYPQHSPQYYIMGNREVLLIMDVDSRIGKIKPNGIICSGYEKGTCKEYGGKPCIYSEGFKSLE